MSSVPVQIMERPGTDDNDDEISYVADVDSLSSTEVMLGCGNDNPY
jgi:hypothetical protein